MKQHWTQFSTLLMTAALLMPVTSTASQQDARTIDDLIRHADSVRSTDAEASAKTLAKLEKLEDAASPTQKRQIRLLRTYQRIRIGKYDEAVKDALSVYEEAPETNLKFRAALLIANSAAITRDFTFGLRHLENALALTDQIQDVELRQQAHLVAAVIYNQYGQFALGQHHARQVTGREASPRNRCIAQQLDIEAKFGLGAQISEAEIETVIADCSAQKEIIVANIGRTYLARIWANRGDVAKAIDLLEGRLSEAEATKYPWLIGEFHGLLAEYRLRSNDLSGAESHANSVLVKGSRDAYSLPLVTAHKVLYEAAVRRGDLKAALNEYRLYAEADKARLDEVKAREFAFQLSRHELQQKNQSIELLQRQNEVLRLQQEISKKSAMNNRLMTVMLLMLLGVGAYWAYKIKRVQVMFRKQAQVDSLTGVSNRRHFRDQAEALMARCQTANREAALVLLDLDNFKRINDRHGHAAGDWVLKKVAAACQASCRDGDLFGRLGGEEFAILTCGGDLHAAERIAQQCREQLAAIDTSQFDGELPAITASFGCATTRLGGYSFETLFMHADHAMYRAKAEGRDRICCHEERPVLVRTPVSA